MTGPTRHLVAGLLLAVAAQAAAQADAGPTDLAARLAQAGFSHMAVGAVAPPWRLVGLPQQKFPLTQFDIRTLEDGMTALRIQAEASYGNLVFDARGASLPGTARLRWRWRLERGLETSDLTRKDGDDTPVKVCALFDMPLGGMSFGEQARLRMARALSGEPLPAATLCYVWDRLLPEGSIVRNVFSARVRYLVVTGGAARPGQWLALDRPLAADFLRAFGDETRVLPALLALAVGADADNTGASSLAFVGDLALAPRP
jgi:hypothetical protein